MSIVGSSGTRHKLHLSCGYCITICCYYIQAHVTHYSGSDQRKYQSSVSLAFVRGFHRWPVNSPHKGPVTRKIFPFDDVIMNFGYHQANDPIVRCTYIKILGNSWAMYISLWCCMPAVFAVLEQHNKISYSWYTVVLHACRFCCPWTT